MPAYTVEMYGVLKRHAAGDEVILNLDRAQCTVQQLLAALEEKYPETGPVLENTACAIGDELVTRMDIISPGQRLSLIPPVSGGQPHSRLQDEPLDLASLLTETRDENCGALVVFGGTVRLDNEGRSVRSIDYTAHAALADKTLREIEQETREKFNVAQCRLVHRLGHLELGELSVLVVVRAGHRPEAFEAARWAIDTLKERVPIWKEEFYTEGDSEYLEGTPLKSRKSRGA